MRYELHATLVEAVVDDDEGLSSVFFRAGPREDGMFSMSRYAAGGDDDGLCEIALGSQELQARTTPASVVLAEGRLDVTFADASFTELGGFQGASVTWDASSVDEAALRAALEHILREPMP